MAKRRAWKPGDVANGHVLGVDGVWRPLATPSRWKPGDVANGHLLGIDGVWRPLPDPPTPLGWGTDHGRRPRRWSSRPGGVAALVVGSIGAFLAVAGAVGIAAGASDNTAGGTTAAPARSAPPTHHQHRSQGRTTGPSESPDSSHRPGHATRHRTDRPARHAIPKPPAKPKLAAPEPAPKPAAATYLVSRVIDGDTIELGNGQTVRLVGIDTPERGECGYEQAAQHMADLVLGKHVVLRISDEDTDSYGRLLRYVDIPAAQSGAGKVIDAGLNQIRSGLAIARYDSRDGYGYHPREQEYVRSDDATQGFSCPKPRPLVHQPAAPSNCMTGYSPCLPVVADLDCADIGHSVAVTGSDPYRLDADGDGTGCD